MRTLLSVLICTAAPVASLSAQRAFDAIERLDITYGTRAVGDFNGDGVPDLVRVDNIGPVDGIRLLDGNALLPFAEIPVPNTVLPVAAAGDVDGDGRSDLVLADQSGFAVAFGDGGGAFPTALFRPLPGEILDLATTDVNGDNRADILVMHVDPGLPPRTVALRCYLSGGGAIASGPVLAIPESAGFQPFAVARPAGQPVRVACFDTAGALLLFDVAQAGTLTQMANIPVIADPFVGTLPVGENDRGGVAAADFNGDQRVDYCVALDSVLQVVLDLPGGLSVLAPQTLPGLKLLGNLAAVDLDGDGDQDLLSRSHPWYGAFPLSRTPILLALTNDGQGTFSAQWEQALATGQGGRIHIVDLDGDGLRDFVGVEHVLRNDGDDQGPWPRWKFDINPFATRYGLRDLDGDGDPDLLPELFPSYTENRGSGVFQGVSGRPAGLPSDRFPIVLGSGDFDGDGLLDYMVRVDQPDPMTQGTLPVRSAFFQGQPDGSVLDAFAPWPSPIPGRDGHEVPDGDVDGDGDLDLIVDAIWLNDGTGQLVQQVALPVGMTVLHVANLDGDPAVELIGTRGSGVIVLDDPAGGATVQVLRANIFVDGRRGVDVGDADGDGDQDILIGILGGRVRWYRNDGAGLFAEGPFPFVATDSFFLAAQWGDVTGDGRLDILVAASGGNLPGSLRVYRQKPGGQFVLWRDYLMPIGAIVDDAVDLDGDGDLDLAASDWSLRHQRFREPHNGGYLQLGDGSQGTGGWRPLLGVLGPIRVGETSTLRLTRGLGGAVAILAIGQGQQPIPGVPFPGLTAYGAPFLSLQPIVLAGSPGVPGAGSHGWLSTTPPGLQGVGLTFQYAVFDPGAPFGLALSNGLAVTIGG